MNSTDLRKFEKLSRKIDAAKFKMMSALERKYPKGSRVKFYIMHNQVNPSTGVVIGYDDKGHFIIQHDNAKCYSRYNPRRVYYTHVF